MEVMEEKNIIEESEKTENELVDEGEMNVSKDEVKEEEKPKIPCLRTLTELKNNQMIIDLESGSIKPRKLTGPELLYQKFLKTQAKPKVNKDKVCMNILSIENGKLGIQKVEIKLDKEVELDHNRPGLSREKLKQNLRNQIAQKRLEIIKNKGLTTEYEPEEKEQKNEKMENKENNINDESDEDYDPEAEEEESEEEEGSEKEEKPKKGSAFIDSEAIDEDEDDNENEDDVENSNESSNESEEEIQQGTQKKGRILKAFIDSEDEESVGKVETKIPNENNAVKSSEENIFKEPAEVFSQATDFTFDEPSISEEILPSRLGELIDSAPDQVEDEDLLDICSGQFFVTQAMKKDKESQDMDSSKIEDEFVSQKEIQEASEKFESENEKLPSNEKVDDDDPTISDEKENVEVKINPRKFLESTDDEADNESEVVAEKKRAKKKKLRQKVKKLGFSDDESEEEDGEVFQDAQELEEDCVEEEEIEVEEDEDEQNDEEEVLIDYDSEENEIEVKMTKNDKIKEAKKYFENEAELSESEWGSADEDEKDMDKYEIELADEEQFDQAQLREEVGRIHARKLMDEDLKNVKKIQELLFEDEENDGVGRERKFRWKNQTEGFTLDDENARDADDNQNEMDDENEALWRKMRHEREILINEQSQKMLENESMTEDILLLDHSSQTVTSTSTSTLIKRKFQIIRTSSVAVDRDINTEMVKKESPFLIKADHRKFSNSFLSKGEKTLAKLASFMSTKGGDDEMTNMSSHGGNSMSFAPIEKSNDTKKRKSEENDGGSAKKSDFKKRKVENHVFLLDQLA